MALLVTIEARPNDAKIAALPGLLHELVAGEAQVSALGCPPRGRSLPKCALYQASIPGQASAWRPALKEIVRTQIR
eukprot:252464-Pleurochrysis_carterae.AAC.3